MTAWPRAAQTRDLGGRRQPRKRSGHPVTDLTPEAMAAKLKATPFERSSASCRRALRCHRRHADGGDAR